MRSLMKWRNGSLKLNNVNATIQMVKKVFRLGGLFLSTHYEQDFSFRVKQDRIELKLKKLGEIK